MCKIRKSQYSKNILYKSENQTSIYEIEEIKTNSNHEYYFEKSKIEAKGDFTQEADKVLSRVLKCFEKMACAITFAGTSDEIGTVGTRVEMPNEIEDLKVKKQGRTSTGYAINFEYNNQKYTLKDDKLKDNKRRLTFIMGNHSRITKEKKLDKYHYKEFLKLTKYWLNKEDTKVMCQVIYVCQEK